jgi:hypothetical protein
VLNALRIGRRREREPAAAARVEAVT